MKTENTAAASARTPPSVIWHDFRNREFSTLKGPESARKPSQAEEVDTLIGGRTEAVESGSRSGREPVGPQQRRIGHGLNRIHNLYIRAAILLPRGIAGPFQVYVDERNSFNLLPLSIAVDLDLNLYFDRTLTIRIADRLVQTNQYCRFTIRVAGLDMTIDGGVISELQTILLGREWTQSVKLLRGSGNQSYYIPVPLDVEAANEKFPDISDAEVKPQDSKEAEVATSDEIGEEYDDDEDGNEDCGDDGSSDGELSSDDHLLSDTELSSGELSSDGQDSLNGDPSSDENSMDGDPSSGNELSLGDDPSSDGEISSGEELAPTDEDEEDDEIYGDDEEYEDDDGDEEDYEAYEGKVCEGCEECDEYASLQED